MVTLVRDRQPIYYALYEGVEEVQKDGLYTGARKKKYAPVVETFMPVSGARTAYGFVSNVVQMDFFGLDKPYSKTMWTHDLDCPIIEETILWMEMGKIKPFSSEETYKAGDLVIYEGIVQLCQSQSVTPSEYDPSDWKKVSHNYIVTGVSRHPNMIGYAIKEVDFREDNN